MITNPASKTLMRFHLQLGPSRYLSAMSTANLPISLKCAYTLHSLVFFALPQHLLLFLNGSNLSPPHCYFQSEYLSGTKVVQAEFLKPREAGQ